MSGPSPSARGRFFCVRTPVRTRITETRDAGPLRPRTDRGHKWRWRSIRSYDDGKQLRPMAKSTPPPAPKLVSAPARASAPRAISRSKRLLFIALSISLPLLAIALLEGGLRLAGYGGYPPTMLEVKTPTGGTVVITDDPGPASYFFGNKDRGGSLTTQAFVSPKPVGTLRVVLAGESAAKGFPQPPALAASAFLREMLRDCLPGRAVEVINLGCTAISSFPVMEILDEMLAYEPDAVVIYCGNNEFFGAYGVASISRGWASPGALRWQRGLRSLGLVQLASDLLAPRPAAASRTLMEIMMAQGYTAPDDPIRGAAATNLETHAAHMARAARQRGARVVLCTLAANERDLAPLGESDVSRLTAPQRQQIESLVKSAEARLPADPAAVGVELDAALKLAPQHATLHYWRGRWLSSQGRPLDALAEYQQAIDFDPMPWRPPGACNDALRRAAAATGAALCDARQAFRDASPGGAIGWELMDDHVHPSLRGQYVLARAIMGGLAAPAGGAALVSSAAVERLGDFESYAARLGDNPYERFGVCHLLRELATIPFIQRSNPGMTARFDRLGDELLAAMPPPLAEVCRQWTDPKTPAKARRPISGNVARELVRQKRVAEAEPLFRLARECVPLYSAWNLEYTYFLLVCRHEMSGGRLGDADRSESAAAIERGRLLLSKGRSESGMAERYMGRMHQLSGEWAEAIPLLLAAQPKLREMDRVACDMALVESYRRTGDAVAARAVIDFGIQNSGPYAESYRRMLGAP